MGWLDSDGVRATGYALVALAAVVAGVREHRRAGSIPYVWPTFWYLTALLFLTMAVGRAGHLAELIADLGREQAEAAGWYSHRRKYQALAVGSVAAVWFIVVVASLWRVPERRRRYLPMALLSFTIVCFAGIRMVSLHQIDSILYRQYIAGARFNAWVEAALLLVALGITFWQPRTTDHRPGGAPPARVDPEREFVQQDPSALL